MVRRCERRVEARHRAPLGQPLDWLCSVSSGGALRGSRGRGAHAAANGWGDGFAQRRRAQV
ncbi:KR domain-containing protein, partial [Mycobacterium tuberculosis]|nr:KR domain-containing protein [Mycobacterium tuberculosis]